jgi:fluoride exporter
MMTPLLIAVGGGRGSLARDRISEALALGPAFPWSTRLVNCSGSFVIGFLAGGAIGDRRLIAPPLGRPVVMAGPCGGDTTVSACSVQTRSMPHAGDVGSASPDVVTSVATGLVATWVGYTRAAALGH